MKDSGIRGTAPTHRELAVVAAAANGLTNKEIGRLLDIQPLTVKSHLSRVGRRFGAGHRETLTLTLLRRGLLTYDTAGNVIVTDPTVTPVARVETPRRGFWVDAPTARRWVGHWPELGAAADRDDLLGRVQGRAA